MRIEDVLNIGRLGTDIDSLVEYYIAEIENEDASIPAIADSNGQSNSSTSNYYVNAKNVSGRWVGDLRSHLGVEGGVDPDAFRRLLEGCHPLTGKPLTPGARAAQSKQQRHQQRRSRTKQNKTLTVAEAAARLELNDRHVRRLLERGAAFGDEAPADVWSYLQGTKTRKNLTGPGRTMWQIPLTEVERFEQVRETASMRPGFDLTLRPPKSVSIVWALGRPEWSEAVAKAHSEAVDEVIDYYGSAAVFSRKRVEGDQIRITTEGLIGAAFDHRTSRAGDPLLHTHVVVFNATLCTDGEWRSLDGTPIYEHAKTGGYLYQAHLRHVLSRELGVRWTEVVNGCAEIEGIPQAVIDTFSKRREEIENAVAETGYTSPGAHQAATLATRRPKGNEPEPPAAVERWWEEARALGFTDEHLAACVSRSVEVSVEGGVPFVDRLTDIFEELAGPEGLTLMMSSFARRDVIRDLAERAVSECSAKDLCRYADQFANTADAVRLNIVGKNSDLVLGKGDAESKAPSVTRFSTPELLGKEAGILSWANRAFDRIGCRCTDQHRRSRLSEAPRTDR